MYISQAKLIQQGNLAQIHQTSFINLYPFVISLFQYFFGDYELSGRIVAVIFGSLSVVLFYSLARLLVDEITAFTAAVFFCVTPSVVEYSSDVLREPMLWFFLFSSLYFAVKGFPNRDWQAVILSSTCAAFALLTRAEGLVAVLLVLSWAIYKQMKEKNPTKYLGHVGLYMFSLISILLLCIYPVKLATGSWDFGHLHLRLEDLLFHGKTQSPTEKIISVITLKEGFENFAETANLYKYLSLSFEPLFKTAKALGLIMVAFFVGGIYLHRLDSRLGEGKIFFTMWLIISLFLCYVHVMDRHYFSTRHGLIIGVAAYVWVAKGFYELCGVTSEFLKKKRLVNFYLDSDKLARTVLIIIVIILIALSLIPYRTEKVDMKVAGSLLKQRGFAGIKIATFPAYSRVLFYAEAVPVMIDEKSDIFEIKNRMRDRNVQYLLIDTRKDLITSHRYFDEFFLKVEIEEFKSLKRYAFQLYRLID
ncbi:MAG: glycosyltransferase family 39 protein [Deltaproteobacteria bacterium]|nr:glycosyltransferase family 39 protein [Deltaproteobacteria bacterium]